jgi:hypothetical protein
LPDDDLAAHPQRRDAADPEGAPEHVEGAHGRLHHQQERERPEGEVVPVQPEEGHADQRRETGRDERRRDQRDQRRELEPGGADGNGERTGGHERTLAEGRLSGVAHQDRQAGDHDRGHDHAHEERQVGQDQRGHTRGHAGKDHQDGPRLGTRHHSRPQLRQHLGHHFASSWAKLRLRAIMMTNISSRATSVW